MTLFPSHRRFWLPSIGGTLRLRANAQFYSRTIKGVSVSDGGSLVLESGNIFTATRLLLQSSGHLAVNNSAISADLVNNGMFSTQAGSNGVGDSRAYVWIIGTVSGTGKIEIQHDSELILQDGAKNTQTIAFVNTSYGGTLGVRGDTGFAGNVSGFGADDKLNFANFKLATFRMAYMQGADGQEGIMSIASGTAHDRFTLLGHYVASGFHTTADSFGGTIVTYSPPPAMAQLASVIAGGSHADVPSAAATYSPPQEVPSLATPHA